MVIGILCGGRLANPSFCRRQLRAQADCGPAGEDGLRIPAPRRGRGGPACRRLLGTHAAALPSAQTGFAPGGCEVRKLYCQRFVQSRPRTSHAGGNRVKSRNLKHLPRGRGACTYESSLSSVCRVARAVSTSTPSSSDWTTGGSPPSPGDSSAHSEGEDGGSAGDAEGLGTRRVA